MSRWRGVSAFALGWWLGRLIGFLFATWRLTRWLRRHAPTIKRITIEKEDPVG